MKHKLANLMRKVFRLDCELDAMGFRWVDFLDTGNSLTPETRALRVLELASAGDLKIFMRDDGDYYLSRNGEIFVGYDDLDELEVEEGENDNGVVHLCGEARLKLVEVNNGKVLNEALAESKDEYVIDEEGKFIKRTATAAS